MLPLHSVCDLIEVFSKFRSMDGDIKSNAKSRQKVPFNRNASLRSAILIPLFRDAVLKVIAQTTTVDCFLKYKIKNLIM